MFKKMKKRFRKQAIIGTVAALTFTGALQTGANVFADTTAPGVELVAASQNGSVNAVQGTTVNFTIAVSLSDSNANVNADVAVNTKYYLNSDGSITSDTPYTYKNLAKNGNFQVSGSVQVNPKYNTGNVSVPIKVTIVNNTAGNSDKSLIVNQIADNFTVKVIAADTTAPVVTISSPVNNGYYTSSTLPVSPTYSVVEANSHTESVTGWDTNAGTHTVTVTSTDASGNVGSASSTYTVDNTAPSISTTLVDGGIYNATTLQNLGKYYSVQDANPGTDSATPLDTTEGDHTAVITATDKAGNTATKTIHYTVDNTAPVISFNFDNNGFYKSSYLSSLNPYYKVEDAHLDPNGVTAPALNLAEGQQNVTVSASDLAGNSSSASASYTVDDTAPTVTIKLDPSKYYNKAALDALGDYYTAADTNLLNVTASPLEENQDGTYQATVDAVDKAGNETKQTVSYNVDNTAPVITFNDELKNGGFYQSSALESIKDSFFTATDAHLKGVSDASLDLTEGQHTVTVTATDEAGNVTTQSITYTIDNTPPEVNFTIQDGSFFTSQALEDLLNGGDYYSDSDHNGVVSVVADQLDLSEGTHTLKVTARDAAGNETTKSVTYTIDNTAPTITFNYTNGGFFKSADFDVNHFFTASDVNLKTAVVTDPQDLVSTEGTHKVTVEATDKAGNSTSEDFTYTIDNTAPTITGSTNLTPNPAGWYNKDVTVSFTADDALSGVASVTNPVTLTEGANQSVTGTATDKAGNSSSTTVSGINIDETKPVITVEDGGTYKVNQHVTWSASDALSGLATPASGTIDTSIPGTHTQTITATDNAGNTAEKTISYTVQYNYGGILQPINSDGSSIFKAGSTVPVKFQLTDISGHYVSTANATISVEKLTDSVLGTYIESSFTSSATGNVFRYDPTSNQYIYNLSTKALTTGTYSLKITLDDGTTHIVKISLK